MLDEIALSRSVRFHVGNELSHSIELVISGEDDPLLGYRLLVAVLVKNDIVLLLQMKKFVDDVDKAILLQNGLPEVFDRVVNPRRVTLLSVEASTTSALVDGQEIG